MTHRTEADTTDTHRLQVHHTLSAIVVAALLLATSAADAALTTGTCLALKRQAWGNLRKCEAVEQAKQLKGKPADLAKCQTKFQEKLATITDKATDKAIACRYGDNGDQTVTDYDTGLMWEQKDGEVGGICFFSPGVVSHCVNSTFDWSDAQAYVGGTSGDGLTILPFLAGHSDWHLPTIAELQTILVAPYPCGTSPCIDSIFGPTVANFYWSATTYATTSDRAWDVDTGNGLVFSFRKDFTGYVRAVRAGL